VQQGFFAKGWHAKRACAACRCRVRTKAFSCIPHYAVPFRLHLVICLSGPPSPPAPPPGLSPRASRSPFLSDVTSLTLSTHRELSRPCGEWFRPCSTPGEKGNASCVPILCAVVLPNPYPDDDAVVPREPVVSRDGRYRRVFRWAHEIVQGSCCSLTFPPPSTTPGSLARLALFVQI